MTPRSTPSMLRRIPQVTILPLSLCRRRKTASYDFAVLNGVAVCLAPPVSLEGSFSGNASATGTYNLSALGKEDWGFLAHRQLWRDTE